MQATAEDFDEIKEVVNNCVDGVNWIKSDEAVLAAGDNTVEFIAAYPDGVPFVIPVSKCIDANGYLISHVITNKSKTGFDINVGKDCTLVYMAVPQR
jgi:hypothetical protein